MRVARLAASIVFVFALAGCRSSGATSSSPGAPAAAADPSVAAASSAPGSGPTTGQSDTDWGRIWDGLPAGFPTIPGATPDDDAAGPASAVFVVDGTGTESVATFLQTELRKAGFSAVGSTEPLEDGNYVLDMTGTPDGCVLQATVKPTGGLTTVTILYGTGCPFE